MVSKVTQNGFSQISRYTVETVMEENKMIKFIAIFSSGITFLRKINGFPSNSI